MFVGVSMEMWGVKLARRQVNTLAKTFVWWLGLGGNYLWCLNVLVIFMGPNGERRAFKVVIWGPQSGRSNLIGRIGLLLATYCLQYPHTVPF